MKSLSEQKKNNLIKALLFTVLFMVTFAVVLKESQYEWSDFSRHTADALSIRKQFADLFTSVSGFQLSYPLWHILVGVTHRINRLIFGNTLGPEYSAALVTALINGLIFLLTDKILTAYHLHNSGLIAFGLSFVMPYTIPGWTDEMHYFAQSSPVIWHNPTNMIVKLFAIAGFYLIIKYLRKIDKKESISGNDRLTLMVVIFLSVLAKPSFFQGIVPTLGLYILIRLIRTGAADMREYCRLCACFIPAFLIILLQYLISFYMGDGGEGIGIGWMVVARDFYPNPWVHLLLALFFPVCYMVLNLKKAAGSLEIRLSLLYVLTTWLEYALLYENGPRMYDGNFEWALCLAFAALWTSASIPFFKDWQDMDLTKTRTKIKNTFLLLTWLLHVVSGLIFFCNLLTAESLYF